MGPIQQITGFMSVWLVVGTVFGDNLLPNHEYDKAENKCDLDLCVELCLQQSAEIVSGNHPFLPTENRKSSDTCYNVTNYCKLTKLPVIKQIDSMRNEVLTLVTLQNDTDKLRDKLDLIRNNLLLLNNTISQVETPLSFQYFNSEYIAILTSKIQTFDLIVVKTQSGQKDGKENKSPICTIRYNAWNETLVGTDQIIDFQRTLVCNAEMYLSSYWYLEPHAIESTFKLRNYYSDEYLGSSTPWYDEVNYYSEVVSSIQFHDECDSRFVWKLEEVSSGGAHLKHYKTNTFIHMKEEIPTLHSSFSPSVFSLECNG